MHFYNAQAHALGGIIRRPISQSVNGGADCSLSTAGGYHSAQAGPFAIANIISFSSASAQCLGSYDVGEVAHNSTATAVLEGFNFQNIVTCDRIVSQLNIRFFDKDTVPEIVPTGCQFIGLRVNGFPVNAELHIGAFTSGHNLNKLRNSYATDSALRANLDTISLWREDPNRLPAPLRWRTMGSAPDVLPESRGMVVTSLLAAPISVPGATTYGNVLEIPGFGLVHFAEFILTENSRRLNMLRFELGCPTDGEVVGGGTEGGGSQYP
ncbi:MAG: hypothetical protein HY820_29305 [Acidobacteria bacterium]|nr:hypothetical protein [Acidobacteriota bacterium]